jgi:gamma-glutamylcyclotransferase (GGCT)/AIG2-like uncharacterized protein YtfP
VAARDSQGQANPFRVGNCAWLSWIDLGPLGPAVDVDLFESADLPQHWARLDEFEGSGYQRVITTVSTEKGERSAWIYVLAAGS